MSRKALFIAALVAGSGIPFANASDGTIDITGELVAQTCDITVDGQDSATAATVTLPELSQAALVGGVGSNAGSTAFKMELNGCVGIATTAAAFFEAGAGVNPVTGNLVNTGDATGVELELFDSASAAATKIKAGDTAQRTTTTRNAITSTAATMDYGVRYVSTDPSPGPGTVVSSVTYAIDYQ
ncbi:type 1 fimbrial protein [Pseudomonas plecoglossicida]|uniref:fimbrial protein n=1 Tax=Pseudomonas plecoglossicida TaxID=70775 RepID=UPI0010F0396D|nr:fimbrial protein [Pseudomonas plecoglossicida]MBA1197010.1 type 1 fimbrial protein [Pseudomonas plecoglossicida]RYZ51119.1 MAG: type 1 fimbrial protein [Sphingobacteriales bacterium]